MHLQRRHQRLHQNRNFRLSEPAGGSESGVSHVRFVLVETSHAGNVGAAARAMKTMGLKQLVLVNPCEYKNYECYARASGAEEIVDAAAVYDTLSDAVADCTSVIGSSARLRSLQWPQLTASQTAHRCCQTASAGQVAVVFGRERSGLTNDELALCNYLLVIPSVPTFSSLNVAAAVQVVAYEIRKRFLAFESTQAASVRSSLPSDSSNENSYPEALLDSGSTCVPDATAPVDDTDPLATHGQVEQLYEHFEAQLQQVGMLDPGNPRLLMSRLRRMFGRAQLRQSEVQILRGYLSAVGKSLDEKR